MSSIYTRRAFMHRQLLTLGALGLPKFLDSWIKKMDAPLKLGVITDLHQDIMHDGFQRLQAFLQAMDLEKPHALLQLGDFAVPSPANQKVINLFNQAHPETLHVLGNHDLDHGYSKEQCLSSWRMPARYYSRLVQDVRIIVLDGNDTGSPLYKGGYPSFIGPEQKAWLIDELNASREPVIMVSHQPLAGTFAVDNAAELQTLLGTYAQKILFAINGHTHIDDVLAVQGVIYMHLNSASYVWVGESFKHQIYPEEVHQRHPWLAYTCPYRESLFTTLTINPAMGTIMIQGKESDWVGPSPAEIGANTFPDLVVGEQIAPRIRVRTLQKKRL